MNLMLLSSILGFVMNLLGTLRGDPAHAKLANALTAVHEVAQAVASGSDINPEPLHDHLQTLVSLGRAPTGDELDGLHAVAKAVINGAVPQQPAPPPTPPAP